MSHDNAPLDFDPNAKYLEEQQAQNAAEAGEPVAPLENSIDFSPLDAGDGRIEPVMGEASPDMLLVQSEAVAIAEKSEFEGFKDNVKQTVSGFADKAKSLWGRLKGGVSSAADASADALWKTAYGAYKAPSVVAGAVESGVNKTIETKDAVVEAVMDTASSLSNSAVETYQDTRDSVVEGARTVGRGIETGAILAVGTAILAGEAIGRKIDSTVELGEKGIDAGRKFVERGIEAAKARKAEAVQKMSAARDASAAAVSSVARAAEANTVEAVNSGKEAIRSGVLAVAEAGVALRNRAESGMRSAWEGLKNKKNMLKRGLVMAKVGYNESQGKRLSEQSAANFARANKARAGLALLEG